MHRIFDNRRYLIPFRATLLPQIFTDVLVIGAGAAGMRAALAAAEAGAEVILISKGRIDESNTAWAQGGIAAVLTEQDSLADHVQDTLTAGAGLCDEAVVRQVIEAGPSEVESLIDWGMPFDLAEPGQFESDHPNPKARPASEDRPASAGPASPPVDESDSSTSADPDQRGADASSKHDSLGQRYAFGREGGHSRHRILHSDGDATGRALAQTLERQVRENENIRIFDQCFVLDLLTLEPAPPAAPPASASQSNDLTIPANKSQSTHTAETGQTNPAPHTPHTAHTPSGGGHCLGAITHHPDYGLQVIWAGASVLASGGCGQLWRESTNPSVATADGLAMAYRAGACMQDMAFMQFHPTTLYVAGASRSLITEAVRGEGAYLIDRHGHRFMPDYDDRAELAPRDVVCRSILAQMAKTGHSHVFLDVRHLGREHFAHRFPGILRLLEHFDIDPGESTIPVHPSAHYMIGGVRTDQRGQTSLDGLYACGEVSCTALHGANRLASNSLLEGLVFGHVAGQAAAAEAADQANGAQSVAGAAAAEPNNDAGSMASNSAAVKQGGGAEHRGGGGGPRRYKIVSDIRPSSRSELDLGDVRSSLRSVMWHHVGIKREGDHLAEVAGMFEFWARYTLDKIFDQRLGWETQNMLTVGALITQAANWRQETRGTHHRVDFLESEDHFKVHDRWQRGSAQPHTAPVNQDDSGVQPGDA